MEYHENPEESREENEGEKKEEFSFMQETIKDENGGYRKIRNTVLKYAGLGLIFGLAACLGFMPSDHGWRTGFPAIPRRSPSRRRKRRRRKERKDSRRRLHLLLRWMITRN